MQEPERENPASELLSLVKRHGIEDPLVYRTLMSIAVDPDKDMLDNFWESVMPSIAYNKLFTSPFPKPGDLDGTLIFALTEMGKPVSWPVEKPHTMIAGSSNTGKTTCYMIMCREALKQKYKAWIFARADDVTALIRIFPDIFHDNFSGRMKINPLCFLGPEAFTSVFTDSFVLFEGSEAYMIEAIKELQRKNADMNLYDLYYFIRSRKHSAFSRTARYQESILNRLGGILNSTLGKAFDCARGHEFDILRSSVIFDVSGMTLSEQKFIVNSLLMFLYHSNSESMKLVFIDDASMLLQEKRDLTLTDDIFSNIRKGGIHMVVCTQSPAELSPGILSNIPNKIFFRLNSGRDIYAMQTSTGVTDYEQRAYFFKLKHEERAAIIEFAGKARPFLGKIIHSDFSRPMSKEELDENDERIARDFSKIVLRARKESKEEKPVSDDERKWLMAVYLNQYRKTVTEIHAIAGFSACKGTKIAQGCLNKQFTGIVEIVKGKGTSKFPVMLEPAYTLLNLEEKKFQGKGCGYEHLIWQFLIAEHFKSYKSEIELNRAGKFIDVAIEHEGRFIAIEVAMTSANEKTNIEKDFEIAKADYVIVACRDEKVLQEARGIISFAEEGMRHRAKACLLSEILKINPEQLINQNKEAQDEK